MGIKTVPQPPYRRDLAPGNFWVFPKLRGCRYEIIEEMKEAVTKVIDTLTQDDFHRAFQKLLEQQNKWIAAGGDYFEGNRVCTINMCPSEKSLETYRMPLVLFSSSLIDSIMSPYVFLIRDLSRWTLKYDNKLNYFLTWLILIFFVAFFHVIEAI